MSDTQERKPFWDHDENKTVAGKFVGFRTYRIPPEERKKNDPEFNIILELDWVLINLSPVQLTQAMGEVVRGGGPKSNDLISIDWGGKSPEGAWHIYSLHINGVLCPRPGGLPRSKETEIAAYFGI